MRLGGKKVKLVLSILVLVLGISVASAQPDSSGDPGCGLDKQKIEVTRTKKYPAMPADPAKAIIYVIQDDSHFGSRPRPTTRIGIDGAWEGATQGGSFFRAALDPGEHHICASWQGFVGINVGARVGALHFTAAPGESYYFRVRDRFIRDHGPAHLELAALDSDEGQLLASKASLSSVSSK